jgi:cell division protease FtsH
MVSIYGLNERIGNVSFYDSQGRDSFTKPYSDDLARVIDEEASKMIEFQYKRALKILADNKEKLSALAEKLLETEVIFKEDLEIIFGKREWEIAELVEIKEIPVKEKKQRKTPVKSEKPVVKSEKKENSAEDLS